jgi:hypothetical protein
MPTSSDLRVQFNTRAGTGEGMADLTALLPTGLWALNIVDVPQSLVSRTRPQAQGC